MSQEATEKLGALLEGSIPEPINTSRLDGDELALAELLNKLFLFWREIQEAILPLSRGQLDKAKLIEKGNYLSSPFKELQSHLLHLTWQAKQVAAGDYSQRVDFMGEFSEAFNTMVVALDQNEKALKSKIQSLEEALAHIARLEGVLPICANCKKVRLEGYRSDQREGWVNIEPYISGRTEATFSHGLCPDCLLEAQQTVKDFDPFGEG